MFKKLRVFAASLLALILAISLSTLSSPAAPKGETITLGYSNWAGWWPSVSYTHLRAHET